MGKKVEGGSGDPYLQAKVTCTCVCIVFNYSFGSLKFT